MKTILSLEGIHSQSSIEQVAEMCAADGHIFEARDSRQGNFQVLSINGVVVARAFNSQSEAFAFQLERA